MTDIYGLTNADQLKVGDLIPIWSADSGDTRRVSISALVTFVLSQIAANSGFVTQYSAPNASGFTVMLAPPVSGTSVFLLLTPAADYVAGTISLPAQSTCIDGQEVLCSCTKAVAALTIDGNGATAVNGAPTTIAANGSFRLRYDAISRAWYSVT